MFQWIRSWFQSPVDRREQAILEQFGFLIDSYGFQYRHTNLGDWLDRNGKPLFSGPLYVYQFYTEKVCLNLLYLVQRDEYYGYLTEKQRNDQLYIRKGTEILAPFGYELPSLAQAVEESLRVENKLLDHSI